jgi:hypothetical protein
MYTTIYRCGIKPTGIYSVQEVSRLLGCSLAFLQAKITDSENPLRYVVDKGTKSMKIEGSELIHYFNLIE